MTREDAKREIKSRYAEYLKPAKKRNTYICPLCGNGTGSTGDGMTVDPHGDRQHLKCFKCGFYGDIIELYEQEHGCSAADAFNALYSLFGLQVEGRGKTATPSEGRPAPRPARNQRPAAEETKPKADDFTALYAEWHTSLLQAPDALAYLERRGIKRETIEAFNLGFCREWAHPLHPEYKSPRIIIPRSASGYTARRIDGGTQYKYQVVGRQGDLFNAGAFSDQERDGSDRHYFPVVVVEGELDAAAIYQGGYKRVIGLGSASNTGRFAKQAAEQNPAAVYVLALDNDPDDPDPQKGRAGQRVQAKLAESMEAAGLDYISADAAALYGEHKDAAYAVLHDTTGETFWRPFMELIEQGYYKRRNREQAAELEAYYRSGPGMVDHFLQEIRGEKYKPIPTGISTIDAAIGGGLFRQTIVMMGAAPGMGKTALASQICESIAKSEAADVLYINLEMSREQLLARSLARIAYNMGYKGLTTTEILQGYRWTGETGEAVQDAADEYKDAIAPHLIYNPGEDTTDLDAILQKMQDEKKRLGHAPIVCLDYLQLLTGHTADGHDEDSVSTIKRAVQKLKEYAIREDTTVIIITANNRASMVTGDSDLNSGRDTSNIEYGADLHLGLVYTATADGTKDIKEIRKMKRDYWQNPADPAAAADYETYCTRISLKVNKNRHGAEGREALLQFNGACALFIPVDTIHDEPPRRAGRIL